MTATEHGLSAEERGVREAEPEPAAAARDAEGASIVIAGAGPVGLMLAYELALAGVRPVVIESRAERSARAPGVAVNAGLVEVLDDRGLMEPLREETFVLPAVHFSLLWLDPSVQSEPHADAYMLPQTRLEQHLEERATALGADVRRGQRVTGFAQDADGVTITVQTTDAEYRMRSHYLVGCDGSRSAVRAMAGIGFPGVEDAQCSGLVGDVAFDMDETDPEHFGAYLSPRGGVYMGAPAGEGVLRVTTFDWVDGAPPPLDEPVTAAQFREVVHRITGRELRGEPLWIERYRNVTRQADAYRRGRVFLAGDAAHTIVPLNGLAMSAGLQDAANLGWKLAAAVHGWAPPGLLDTYHAERHPAGRRVCRDTQAQAELFNPPERVGPLREIISDLLQFDEVRRYVIGAVSGFGVKYRFDDVSESHPLLGARLPQLALACEDGERYTYELLHAGHAVVLDLSGDPAAGATLSAAVDLSGWKDRVEVALAAPVPGIDAAALLLRPDGHVAWLGTGRQEERYIGIAAALERWFGAPAR